MKLRVSTTIGGSLALFFFSGCSSSEAKKPPASQDDPVVIWTLDSTTSVNGQTPTVLGGPTVTSVEQGSAVCFDGVDDGLVFAMNPLEGLSAFTVEVSFRPDTDGPAQQRFVHLQEGGTENRAMLETRVAGASFYLDTFLASGAAEVTLAEPTLLHPTATFHWAALSYANGQMRQFVDGVEELSGALTFAPLGPGQMSLGVRLNLQYWFKGCIRELRFSPSALPAEKLQKPL